MVKERDNFIPLEKLVSGDVLQLVDDFDLQSFQQVTEVRGKRLGWLCLSRRLLWMAHGHEYIESELLDWIDNLPASSVLYDIGASTGIFALYAAAKGHRVSAFEPDPTNYFLLAFNNYINSKRFNFSLEACLNVAISSSEGLGRLEVAEMEIGAHRKILDKSTDVYGNHFSPDYTHPVMKSSLDQLIASYGLPKPDHLKIDVDGAELEVLLGAVDCLASVSSVFIEVTSEFLEQVATLFFADRGFVLEAKFPVQRYPHLYNCIFSKR